LSVAVLSFVVCAIGLSQGAKPAAEPKVRDIFVPFEDLEVLLEGPDQRVLLTREEYDALLARAKLAPPGDKPSRTRVLLAADYEGAVQEGRATIRGKLVLELLNSWPTTWLPSLWRCAE
jgi:hypothetical protein